MSMITVTPLKGDPIQVEFKDIRGHVGDNGHYHSYRLRSGATINVAESLDEIRALNKKVVHTAPEVDENHIEE